MPPDTSRNEIFRNFPGKEKCSWEKTIGFLFLWYAHEYIDELRADWLVYNE